MSSSAASRSVSPADAVVIGHEYGFRPSSAAQAAATVGYQPLLPSNTLGRPLRELAAAKKTTFPIPNGPSFSDAVAARYGDGAATITVSTWRGTIMNGIRVSLLPSGSPSPAHLAPA